MAVSRDDVNSIDRHIGRRVRIRRQMLRMSAAEAAAKLGVPQAVFAEYEDGLLRLDPRALMRLRTVLGVRVRYFYDGITLAPDAAAPVQRRVND
jgi:transcriptional regulator with XRE-family HTH domain